MNWSPIDWDALEERPPVEPVHGLIYPGRRHVFSGPPESAKTWAAFALALDEIRAGGVVLHVDFEMFAYETRERLRALGATADEFTRFLHIEPETPASEDEIAELMRWNTTPTLAIIDAAAGAFDLQCLDDNSRRDAETFARTFIEPFRCRDIATILLDHVVKNADNRGRFTIGSERKVGGADVHLGFETVVPFGRGRTGRVKVTTHKDRFGFLHRPVAAELELRSDPDTFDVSWGYTTAEQTETGGFRPTYLMERVSRFLEDCDEPASRSAVEAAKLGKSAEHVRMAMDVLIDEGCIAETNGARGARLMTSIRPYREANSSTSSDLVSARPDEVIATSSTSSPPSRGTRYETRSGSNGASPRPDEVELANAPEWEKAYWARRAS